MSNPRSMPAASREGAATMDQSSEFSTASMIAGDKDNETSSSAGQQMDRPGKAALWSLIWGFAVLFAYLGINQGYFTEKLTVFGNQIIAIVGGG
ncbi:MAG: hypothetical protein ACPGNT_03505 [Rhodospirillales bacterium]